MHVTVTYCAQIRKAVGRESERVDVPDGTTAQDLVRLLAERHGDPLRGFLLEDGGGPRTSNLLVVGEAQVGWEAPRRLADGDRVTILPAISGGR